MPHLHTVQLITTKVKRNTSCHRLRYRTYLLVCANVLYLAVYVVLSVIRILYCVEFLYAGVCKLQLLVKQHRPTADEWLHCGGYCWTVLSCSVYVLLQKISLYMRMNVMIQVINTKTYLHNTIIMLLHWKNKCLEQLMYQLHQLTHGTWLYMVMYNECISNIYSLYM